MWQVMPDAPFWGVDFYSHIPCGMWPQSALWMYAINNFYSHIPCGMWRRRAFPPKTYRIHFYSHIPCGMWRSSVAPVGTEKKFLLTHPVWDVTYPCENIGMQTVNFYSHIPCGMWQKITCRISAHLNFYSHIPCGMWQLYIVYFNHIIPIYYRMDL